MSTRTEWQAKTSNLIKLIFFRFTLVVFNYVQLHIIPYIGCLFITIILNDGIKIIKQVLDCLHLFLI